ncbi:chemotaxis response regulator protein-glutamate methylesterase [Aggregicoccus sp. 17bor-14]|uniref:protein-glutamate methylesterase/protein-glutamine glutaminase n=1 Tax=Myxococcaceae TaxID=31 RepID=UPI00129C99E6|nr:MULTISPECIES: chemotaxis response regulator protein-glutamate methylesterase [Myxococcaceae]MBF5046351.1 chemotaxis response regulator protein-glutamate methylesterase [Simulacricoccus sp. 17bor-14]MRI92071.1 chemotaxis response regulator protein-glutamate methylesterase [Aggregicoccus sp. 17bor-14]
MSADGTTRVLVVDDSAHNRRVLTTLLESVPDVRVVDRAQDGEEGLRKVKLLRPDVITLDLEMPKLDGYGFLRLLMSSVPTPVIVVSSYAHRVDVFKALELGAFDFVAKPSRATPDAQEALRTTLLEKVHAARLARPAPARPEPGAPLAVVAIGASTGGPPAVQRLLEALSAEPSACVLVAQHMPEHFTRAFAQRLDRLGPFTVKEAEDGDEALPAHAFIAPGGRQLVLERQGAKLLLRTPASDPTDRHAPSVDRLFKSVAACLGPQALGVVLTGMGSDGSRGARAIRDAGGEVWAESEETAVIFGMPKEAIATGAVRRVLPLGDIGQALLARLRVGR